MQSPFPGMDPYLEAHWTDVHVSLITEIRNALNQGLPDDLLASAEERVLVEGWDDERHAYRPDVGVRETPGALHFTEEPSGVLLTAPVRLVVEMEPLVERSVRVVESDSGRLITSIEVISPANKSGSGLQRFVERREELLAAGINCVEIDLIRAGDWRALIKPHHCDEHSVSTYRVSARIPRDPKALYLFPIGLTQPLPMVAIPLRPRDPEVRLSLQPLIERAYSNGRYSRRLNYQLPCVPPLDTAEQAAVQTLLGGA